MAAGVAQQVPWDSWEDITRIGGEVAEVEVKDHTPTPKKAGRKPKMESVKQAVGEYLEPRRCRRPMPGGKGRKRQ